MQSQQLVLAQKQQLKLSPQMYQSLELMALPLMELREKIRNEIEKNPALTLEPERSLSFERIEGNQASGGSIDPFENSSDAGYIRKARDYDPDSKQKFLEGALSRPQSLQDYLIEQLHLLQLDPQELAMGELIISNLDRNGFYRIPPEDLVGEGDLPLMEKMISEIRQFDPPGVCASGFIESLIIQAQLSKTAPKGTEQIISGYLELVRRGKIPDIARELGMLPEEVEEAVRFIKTLTPYPGSSFSDQATQYITPDLIIRMVDGQLVMKLNADSIPVVRIDPEFEKLAEEDLHGNRETERYIQQSLKDARWLIGSIHMRSSTLQRVGAALLAYQKDFFLHGPKYLRPLILSVIAEEVGVHETTVSRISNAKYVQTDFGIFPVKYFFTNAVQGTGDDGKEVSKTGVKEIIREIVSGYEGKKRLSDQRISDLLAERGITVARRTVAKYRKELNIDSSFER